MKLFGFAVATAVATLALLVVGGTVNPTGSSLACPDWPLCYGSLFPEMTNGVQFEHTHRLVATLVGVMTIGLTVAVWRSERTDVATRRLTLLASGLVVVQGVLGGITVLLRLPMLVSTTHLAVSMAFFGLILYLCFRLWPGPRSARDSARSDPPATVRRGWVAVAGLGVYVQILLGGVVRHTHSGHACGGTFPWCVGAAWPNWGPGQIHMIHRYGAVVVVVLVLVAAAVAYRRASRHGLRLARIAALVAPLLVTGQFLLGVVTVTSYIAVIPVTAHLAVGALLLADMVILHTALGPQREGYALARGTASRREGVRRPVPESRSSELAA